MKKSIVVSALAGVAATTCIGTVLVFALPRDVDTQQQAQPTPTSTTQQTPPPPPSVNSGPAPLDVGSFSIEGAVPLTGATYDSMPYVLPLDPAGPQDTMVRWVEGWGQPPSKAHDGTVYILGHAWAQQKLVFNPISEQVSAAVRLDAAPEQVPAVSGGTVPRFSSDILNGSKLRVTDEHGASREWVVDNAWLVNKQDAIEDAELVNTTIPGRVILIACAVKDNQDLDYNVIISGHLT
ncbi:MAG: sortase [Corynebacterium sp.]|nr:sortase [Corynebacterium sp.]